MSYNKLKKKSHAVADFSVNNLDVLKEQRIDLTNRAIYLEEEITLSTGQEFSRDVNFIFQATQDNSSPITVYLSTCGGDSFGTFGLIDVMASLPTKVNIHCIGCAFSAGSLILACGTGLRTISGNSMIMVHRVQPDSDGGLSAAQKKSEDAMTDLLNSRLFEILGQKTKQNAAFWRKNTKTNLYLTADKALEYGLVDVIA